MNYKIIVKNGFDVVIFEEIVKANNPNDALIKLIHEDKIIIDLDDQIIIDLAD